MNQLLVGLSSYWVQGVARKKHLSQSRTTMRTALFVLLMTPALAVSGSTIPNTVATQPSVTLETVLVKGSQPGPGMWRVSSGDHALWILGTLSPLPDDIAWQSTDVEAAIADSQEVLGVGRAKAKIGVGTMLKMASLAPSALRTQRNVGGGSLKTVVAPSLYARWVLARDRYVNSAKGLETLRPLHASQQLYWSAVDAVGMTTTNVVAPVVAAAAKGAGLSITDTGFSYPLDLDRRELKKRIDALNQTGGNDIVCFETTLDRLEADLAAMKLRANAWAVGDIGALRGLSRADFQPPCRVVEEAEMAFLGAEAIRQKLRAAWLHAAQRSLAQNQSTFASLPISDLLDDTGVLQDLRKLGFRVEAPDDEPVD